MSARARTAVLSVAAVLVVSRLLGFVREMVIADKFGTSAQYDLYLIALILPALAYGVINFASYYLFVPFITRKLEQQPELSDAAASWRNLWPAINLTHLLSLAITLGIVLTAPLIMKIWGRDYDAEQFARIVWFSRLTAVMVLLGTSEAFMRAYLNVRKIYSYPAAGYIVFNLTSILSILLLHHQLGVAAVAVGLVGGLFLQNVYLSLRLAGFHPLSGFRAVIWSDESRAFIGTASILLLIELINRSYFLADRYVAPGFGEGVVSALNYCQVLVQLPESILGFAIGAVVFPMFSASASANQRERFAETYRTAVNSALLFAVPLAVFMYLYAEPLVRLLFQRGAFDAESARVTSELFRPYIPAVLALFVVSTSVRACYGAGWGKTVLLFAAVMLLVKFAATGILPLWFGYQGISAATSLAHLGMALMLMILTIRRSAAVAGRRIGFDILRLLASGATAFVVTLLVDSYLLCRLDESSLLALIIKLIISAAVVLASFVSGGLIFGVKRVFADYIALRQGSQT
ncbi:MAG TPA: lipid II flippase MurJ [candidate division Zixibacteria bacterium]|nr:lipid II flippase MurJ [candidate division Zixibacteria bacterium]